MWWINVQDVLVNPTVTGVKCRHALTDKDNVQPCCAVHDVRLCLASTTTPADHKAARIAQALGHMHLVCNQLQFEPSVPCPFLRREDKKCNPCIALLDGEIASSTESCNEPRVAADGASRP